MAISYKDLNPTESSFTLNGVEYFLRPFDLVARVWASDYFANPENKEGLQVLSDLVQDLSSFDAVYRCAWHLLKRKRDFGNYEAFVSAIEKGDESKNQNVITGEIYNAFVKTLGVSEPQMEKYREDIEIKKQSAGAN